MAWLAAWYRVPQPVATNCPPASKVREGSDGIVPADVHGLPIGPHDPERWRGPVETLADAEEEQIRRVLAATGGNKSKAAQVLGIERKTLYRKLERMRL